MRRPPVACRRAAQSLQLPAAHHIWISDDLLTRALNRFFPSSCPHQRRHGSHIPGPLEAKRRAAKRRMTVSAGFHPQNSLQSLFNWTTLFGFRRDSHPVWRYEAPSLQHSAHPPDLSNQQLANLPALSSHRTQDEHVPPTASLQDLYPITPQINGLQGKTDTKADRAGPASASVVSTPGNFSDINVPVQAYFDSFRSKLACAGHLSAAERNRFLIEAWRSCCPVRSDAWVYNTMVLQHLSDFACDPSSILSEHECFTLPPLYTPESQSLLSGLDKSSKRFAHASKIYHRIFVKLAESAKSAEASNSSLQDAELLSIIRLTLQGAGSSSKDTKHTVAQSLAAVADKLQDAHVRNSLRSILMGTTSVEQIMAFLLANAAEYNPCATAEQVLSCFPRKRLQSLVPSITLSLAAAFAHTDCPGEDHGYRLSAWLKVLESLDKRSGPHQSGSSYFDTAITALIKRFFSSKDPRVWSHVLLHPLAFRLTQQESYAAYRDRVLQLLHASPAFIHRQQEHLAYETIMALVFSQMKRETLPYIPLMDMTVKVFARHADLFSIYRVLFALNQQGLGLQSVSRAHARVRKEMASFLDRPESMGERERQHYAFNLRISQGIIDLLIKLTSSSSTTGALSDTRQQLLTLQARREFTEILDRARENRALPQMYADTSADISPSDRTVLIHQLAHLYSLSATRSHRETWRSIYYLCRYLQSHSLPIGPLFTKAVVRAAIIRPMMEHRFISARRLVWVCQLVAKVEGEHVAKQIESNYWRWRGELIRNAKRVHDGAGGDYRNKALVGRMKGLGLV